MSGELLNAIGAASAIFLASAGSAYASAHSGRFALKTHRVLGLKSLIPIVISGVLAIYGLIIGIILVHKFEGDEPISDSDGCRYLAGGLLVGFACLSSGVGMGLFLQPAVYARQRRSRAHLDARLVVRGPQQEVSEAHHRGAVVPLGAQHRGQGAAVGAHAS